MTGARIYAMICRPIFQYAHVLLCNARRPTLYNIDIGERSSLRITTMRHPTNPLYNPSNVFLYQQSQIAPILERIHNLNMKFVNYPQNLNAIYPLILITNSAIPPKRKHSFSNPIWISNEVAKLILFLIFILGAR